MAYELTYTVHYTNEEGQEVLFTISRKDVVPAEVLDYLCTSFEITKNGDDNRYATIISQQLLIGINVSESGGIDWDTFFSGTHDEWKIECEIEGKYFFHGFILPDEGQAPLQDKPYEIKIRAVDGFHLLKGKQVTRIDGTAFKGDYTLIEYIAAFVFPMGLGLPIQCRCNIYHLVMQNRGSGLENDMFGQAELNHQTFKKDSVEFYSCYDALERILKGWACIQYFDGRWLIKCIQESQYNTSDEYYTEYDSNGENPVGSIDTGDQAQVGKNIDNYPILVDQDITAEPANKSVKTKFMYDVWPEIPLNNKFERGAEFTNGTATDEYDLDGDGNTTEIIGTFKKFSIEDWTYGGWSGSPSSLPSLSATSDLAYRKSTYDENNNELYREIILESSGAPQKFLQASALPVKQNDKLKISFDFRTVGTGDGTKQILAIYIIPSSGGASRWSLESQNTSAMTPFVWVNSFQFISRFYETAEDFSSYTSINIDTPPLPVDGTLYVVFQNSATSNPHYYRNFSLEYFTFIAGLTNVKGDYWKRTQTPVYLDTQENEIFISDSVRQMVKGAVLWNGVLLDPTWYRWPNTTEISAFKDIINQGQFNASYRRFRRIEGTFNYINFAPANNPLDRPPLNTIKKFRFLDMSPQRDFVLVPPLRMDIWKGRFKGTFIEVSNPGDSEETGGGVNMTDVLQGLVDALNQTAIDSGENIVATVFSITGRIIEVEYDSTENSTGSVDINGAGNSPSITEVYDNISGPNRRTLYQIGTDVAAGNIFTVTIYGFDSDYQAVGTPVITVPTDGAQEGTKEFKYIF